jgi:uncharacterized protein
VNTDALLAAAAALLVDPVDEESIVDADGHLVFARCDSCGYRRFPPGPRCPECLSDHSTLERDTGLGTVWSFCVYHRAYDPAFEGALPYNVALIELDSGPRLVSNVLDVSPAALRVGMPVVAAPRQVGAGRWLVYFEPAPDKEAR